MEAAALSAAAAHGAPTPKAAGLTVISYNILACRGFPETEENRARLMPAKETMPARLALELQLYTPDLVTFQESPFEPVVAEIARHMGMRYAFFPGGWPGNDEWPGGFPGTVMTRFPILEQENCPIAGGGKCPEELFTRHWGRALLQTDAGELAVFSAHLNPFDAQVRADEITEILKVIEPELKRGRSLLFQGDLNHTPDGPEYVRWKEAGLVDVLAAKGRGMLYSVPVDAPKARIDYIWAHGPIAERLVESRILFEGAFRTNPEDPASFALSDHLPALAQFG